MTLTALVYRDEDGKLCGSVPELPGCNSQGETREELITYLRDAARLWLEVQRAKALRRSRDENAEATALVL